MTKHRYQLNPLSLLENPKNKTNPDFRAPTDLDKPALSVLMLSAYKGTIDSEGENLEDARNEIDGYFDNSPLLEHSALQRNGNQISSACLVTYLKKQDSPLIAYIMTEPNAKRTGIAKQLLTATLIKLEAAGYDKVLAAITDGNIPSERLFATLGFERIS